MSIVNHKDKRTGVTYVYESESYWDKVKKQPRSKRTLIGKIDGVTGEIIPTGKSGRKKSTQEVEPITSHIQLIAEKDAIIASLKAEIAALKKEKQEILKSIKILHQKWSD